MAISGKHYYRCLQQITLTSIAIALNYIVETFFHTSYVVIGRNPTRFLWNYIDINSNGQVTSKLCSTTLILTFLIVIGPNRHLNYKSCNFTVQNWPCSIAGSNYDKSIAIGSIIYTYTHHKSLSRYWIKSNSHKLHWHRLRMAVVLWLTSMGTITMWSAVKTTNGTDGNWYRETQVSAHHYCKSLKMSDID